MLNRVRIKKYSSIFVLFLSLLVLIIKSPFTQFKIYEEQCADNPQLIDFIYIQFLFFTAVVVTTLLIYFLFKKELFVKKSSFFIWLYSLFYLLSRIPYGFDVTDQGYHLSKSWLFFNSSSASNFEITFLTSLVGGFWLEIFGTPSLLWARFGYALLVSGIIYFSTKIVFLFMEKELSRIIILFFTSLFLIHYNYYMTINYDNFPVFLSLISVYFLFKHFNAETDKLKYSYMIVSGIFIALAVLSKVTMVFLLIIPLILHFDIYKCKINKGLFYYAFGFFVVLLLAITALLWSGNLENYKNSMVSTSIKHRIDVDKTYEIFDVFLTDSMKNEELRTGNSYYLSHESHSLKLLFARYSADLWNMLKYTLSFFFAIVIIQIAIGVFRIKLLHYALILIFGFVIIHGNDTSFSEFPVLMIGLINSIFLLLLYSGTLGTKLKPLFFCSYAIFFISFTGSNVSFNTGFRSGGAFLIFYSILSLGSNNSERTLFGYKINNKYNIILVLLVMMFSVKNVQWLDVHRDAEKKFLNYMSKSPQLFGIFSTKERMKSVDGLIKHIISHKKENNKAVFINQFPIFHYLLQKDVVLESPWIEVGDFNSSVMLMENLTEKDEPAFIVMGKVSGRSDIWPVDDVNINDYKSRLKWRDYYKYFIKKRGYSLGYQNESFEVYSK